MKKKKNIFKRLLFWLLVIPTLLIAALIGVVYAKQDHVVQELISVVNKDFKGEFSISDSHISLFENFPYISIDLDDLKLYESKDKTKTPVVDVKDIYLGFDLLTIINGKMEIKSIKLKNARLNVVQSAAGEFNILKALEATHPIENAQSEFHLDLQSIELENVDLTKLNESNGLTIEAFINRARSKFKTSPDHLAAALDAKFVINIIQGKDTTFFKHKHIDFDTQLDYNQKEQKISVAASTLAIEHVVLGFEGSADLTGEPELDLKLKGTKSNFDLFLALVPEDLLPVLSKYDNKGKIYFDASIKGKVSATQMPKINVNFGCEDAFLQNTETHKTLDKLNFKAHFTNGDSAKLSTMRFSLTDFTSRPEAGVFSGHLRVNNFESPEIDTKIVSDFDLDFLYRFFEIKDVEDLRGKVKLTMNFKDVIDLEHPERAIEKLNESYFTQLNVSGLGFKAKAFHLPVQDVNIVATLTGHEANIKRFEAKVGKSDLSIQGRISDLPAIIHHTKDPVESVLKIKSRFLDLQQLTSGDKKSKPVDEQIENLSLQFSFKSSARAFTESPNLPVGEFFVDNLYAKLKHYPHALHDFHADLFIDSSDFRILDFTGMIDNSDFHFSGKLKNYNLWFADTSRGDTRIDFELKSKLMRLEDLFVYKGENFVPEDYRHEELREFKLRGYTLMHFNNNHLKSTDLYLEKFSALLKIHHYKFQRFKGRVHFEDDHLTVQEFSGKLGKSDFIVDLNYYLGKDEKIKKRDNHFGIKAKHLDLDELFNFKPYPSTATVSPEQHEKGFNIYELPFTTMTFDLDVGHLNYHHYTIDNFVGKLRTTPDHYLYFDNLSLVAADGKINMKGYFNGSDKDHIYFSPDLDFKKIDLDKLLLKFENFGQDHIVSENIHGKLSGKITGKVRVHRDMVPILDESELHMDIEITEGRLEKYAPLNALSDYFKDKNLNKVLFDTLQNHMDLNKGEMVFPNMTINSSLGFIEVSGKQDMKSNMEYYFKVPMKLVTGVARQKLFGSSKDEEIDPEREDAIQYKDPTKKTRYVNLKITGTAEGYKVALGKDKSVAKK